MSLGETEAQEVLHQMINGLKKMVRKKIADALKVLPGKANEALLAIVRSVAGAILGFLGKAVPFVVEHTLTLIVFVVGLIGV